MNLEFIPYEQALELKRLGFDEKCLGHYNGKGDSSIYFNNKRDASGDYIPFIKHERLTWFGAPLYSQAFRWFREKHKLHNGIYPYYDKYEFQIKDFRLPTNTPINGGLMNYEEAELACLIKLIEIVKNK
jgi:hypothetical protein